MPIETTPVLGYKSIVIVRRARVPSRTVPGEILLDTVNYALSPRDIFQGYIIYGLLYLSLINACRLEQKECAAFAIFASSLQRNCMEWLDLKIIMDQQYATEEMVTEFARRWMCYYESACRRRKQLSARADWHATLGLTAFQIVSDPSLRLVR